MNCWTETQINQYPPQSEVSLQTRAQKPNSIVANTLSKVWLEQSHILSRVRSKGCWPPAKATLTRDRVATEPDVYCRALSEAACHLTPTQWLVILTINWNHIWSFKKKWRSGLILIFRDFSSVGPRMRGMRFITSPYDFNSWMFTSVGSLSQTASV